MKKRLLLTIVALLLVVGVIAGIKVLQIRRMIDSGKHFTPQPEPVTTARLRSEIWETSLTAVGSFAAVQGVNVAAEAPGKVVDISFTPGALVRRGDLLVQQDISAEQAQLRSAEVGVELARLNFARAQRLIGDGAVSRSNYDDLDARLKEAIAQTDNLKALIARKSIRAPFSGRLGIRMVNLGQMLREGDALVSLQTLDPIFLNFQLPQQALTQLKTGLTVRFTIDALPGETLEGKITTVSPEIDSATRNVLIQANVANPKEKLRPGMFANINLVMPEQEKVLAIPATAVLYAPFGDSVFVIEEKKDALTGKTEKIARQQFIKLGNKRGDFIAVLSGLQEKETVVSTGVFKLRNGQTVKEANELAPEFKLAPKPEDA